MDAEIRWLLETAFELLERGMENWPADAPERIAAQASIDQLKAFMAEDDQEVEP
jgi:hypothetical protein